MPKLKNDPNELFASFVSSRPGLKIFKRKELEAHADANGFKRSLSWDVIRANTVAIKRGTYQLQTNVQPLFPSAAPVAAPIAAPVPAPKLQVVTNEDCYVPEKMRTFVKWGHYKDMMAIIKSRMFYPVFVTGLSGNGKTMMIEQACAELGRQYIRIQINPETDEDDLIGGFRLINGETVFSKGPVIKAMEAGAILLLDEVDRGSNKLMALQGVLEGKPVLIKKTGETILPAPGFNVIATGNTKGRGSEDGRFIAATIIDEAFLERFTITMEQPYPDESVERKIVTKHMEMYDAVDSDFAENLTKWSVAIRKTFEDGGIEEIISTRRLCHIVQTYSIFGNRLKAVELCVSRFDADTRTAMVDLYTKIDASARSTKISTSSDSSVPDYSDESTF